MEQEHGIIDPIRKKRLGEQGYTGFTDSELYNFKFGIRFAYYACGSIVLIGLLLADPKILTLAVIIAFFGMLPPYHPFDYLYNFGIRHVLHKPKLPARTNQGRFACGIATVWLTGVIVLFNLDLTIWAYVTGGLLVSVATLVSTTDICIPSMIYNFLFRSKVTPPQ